MKRILSILTTDEKGGGEYANVDLLEALIRERGLDATLVTNMPGLADGTDVPVRVADLGPKLSQRSKLRLGLRAPQLLLRFGRAARGADVLLLHFKKEQLLSLGLPRRRRIVWAEWGPLPFPMRRGPGRWAYRIASMRAAAILCVSPGTAETIVAAGVREDKVSVVPNLVDTTPLADDRGARERLRAEWGLTDDSFAVACIARFQHKKRNDVVIDMLDHLDDPRVVLLMAGSGPDEQTLRERAARHGDRVRFLGTPRGWVRELLAASDLSVFAPSPTEGAPRTVILAQLAGRVVVATGREGTSELIPEGTGTIVSPPHDPAALAAVVRAYLDDPGRRAREGAAAREHAAARYDRDRILDAWVAALTS